MARHRQLIGCRVWVFARFDYSVVVAVWRMVWKLSLFLASDASLLLQCPVRDPTIERDPRTGPDLKETEMQLPRILSVLLFVIAAVVSPAAQAQGMSPFQNGWVLDDAASELRYMSVKKSNVAETNKFATLSGLITEFGVAQVRVLLDSVDTGVDLRNVRMRFLFFETFLHPEATITAQLDPAQLNDLAGSRRKVIDMDYALSLHGVTVNKTAEVAITLLSDDRVSVASVKPIPLKLVEFDLEGGRGKLEEAASVDITPLGIVTFNFVFDRAGAGTSNTTAQPAPVATAPETPAAAAIETKGNLDREACVGRFEILSRTGNIYFTPASDRLDAKSIPLLDNVFDIVSRCPDIAIEIAGHTDSDGSAAWNKTLSEKRAASVAKYLVEKGIPNARIRTVGYGETQPLVPNTSRENKARNRRIEFATVE